VIGELLATISTDPAVLARIGGPIGDAARDAAADLAEMPPDEARGWRVRMIAALRAPIPPGIRGVHPTWIEAGLVGLPARARTAIISTAPSPADVWLARWALAAIPPLPAIDLALATPRSLADALRLAPQALTNWLANAGADQLAHALASQPEALRALARVVGDRVVIAATRIKHAPRAGALGPTRDAITRCKGDATNDLLVRIGVRALAPHTDALSRRQLALRLPQNLGLLDELVTHATLPIERAPTWAALGAA
jgi:hypothetical protein